MKKIYSAIVTTIAVFGLVSCSEKLDIEQHGNVSTKEDYYKTEEQVLTGVAAMYEQMQLLQEPLLYSLQQMDDDVYAGGQTRGDNMGLEQMNEYTFDASSASIQMLYTRLYNLIYKASLVSDNVSTETSYGARAVNEAKVMRAFANFYIVNLWGTAPLVDHVLQPDEYHVTNSTPADFWASIESDLNAAISSGTLPSKTSITDRNTGIRLTKETAYALLGKAYLWQGKYSDAVNAFDEVINSGLYGLYGIAEPGEYWDLQHSVSQNCCESMIEAQRRDDPAVESRTTGWVCMSLRDSYFSSTNDDIAWGWNFVNPTKSLYDAFVAEEGVDGYRLKATIRTKESLKEVGLNVGDVAIPGNDGLFNWKYTLTKGDLFRDVPGFQAFNDKGWKILRYAEVLLCASEANLMAGNQAKADEYLNQVRRRAKLPDKSGVTLTDIKTEKRLELCIEDVRYLDLLRWGDAKTVLANQGHYIPEYTNSTATDTEEVLATKYSNTVYGWKDRNQYLPIPANEIMVNPNIKQNQGW